MGYANYTNSDVKRQIEMGIVPSQLPVLLGSFEEIEYSHYFQYAERRWPDDNYHPELPHIVYVGDGQPRLAKVLKTVAYILCNDGDLQKWSIKKHINYKF